MKAGGRLEALLERGEFVVTAEVGPPKGASSKGIRSHAALLKDFVDAINITDNQTAIVRLCSLAGALHVLAEGAEPVMQITCRDRNRIAIQSDVLGAASLGIKNILCLTGDHQSFGNHPGARNVFDLDSIQLISMLKGMRDEKRFQCGEEMKVEPRIFIGAAENPFADPLEFRAVRLAKKVAAGADFIQTQGIFDLERFHRFMEAVREAGLHKRVAILAGVIPAKSFGAMKYMSTVPGMSIPRALLDRMKAAEKPEEEGVNICVELIRELRKVEGVRGVHIMAVAWESIVPTIVERAGLLPRPQAALPA
ncbi:MAG: methylenetetrahydrofolate reductase [Acetobacteraceae bacterium]|nr:methylenetetrahydrofolate reductase [Acetobacteraceae bacterium]